MSIAAKWAPMPPMEAGVPILEAQRVLEVQRGMGSEMDTAATHGSPCEEEVLLQGFHELETPEGFRAEFIEGEIVVTPPPGGTHEGVISRIVRQIVRSAHVEMDFSGNKGLQLARGGHCTKNYVIPDAVFAPLDLGLFWDAGSWMEPEGVAMVLEVTSSGPERDRNAKRRCYARSRVPVFLLIDREEKQAWLLTEPDAEAEDYHNVTWVAFGDPLELPEPFGFALQTTDFR